MGRHDRFNIIFNFKSKAVIDANLYKYVFQRDPSMERSPGCWRMQRECEF